jgi:heterodisulfide reductase subunit C
MSFRRLILSKTGIDVNRCRGCQLCNGVYSREQDIPLDSLIQLIIMNEEDILTSRTLWSDEVLRNAYKACVRELNLEKIIMVLREEAIRRGIVQVEKHTDGL